jgi:hypothetical protein
MPVLYLQYHGLACSAIRACLALVIVSGGIRYLLAVV